MFMLISFHINYAEHPSLSFPVYHFVWVYTSWQSEALRVSPILPYCHRASARCSLYIYMMQIYEMRYNSNSINKNENASF